ncbi:MAG TPA: beta-L-arabinofuranosidase domain-containing protein [Cyclobacteriaceae bacterium]|nr:beta-L-arabinofuranosidase domain-containing protein [Cyclobacteriaceae bacterium]
MNPSNKKLVLLSFIGAALWLLSGCNSPLKNESVDGKKWINPVIAHVSVDDAFWSPKLATWQTVTANDIFDKFEGKYTPEGLYLEKDFKVMGGTRNAFLNFDLVAKGKRGIGMHHGPPWYDGLIYESIRGTADLLAHHRDSLLEARIDGYVDRIGAAQESEKDGYINTYTQLMEPGHRWGFNGGFLRWQHEVYNSGMLVEAGIHYYRATGKTKLLTIATKVANLMYDEMGPAPKKNVVPAHSGPEEALIKLYQLYRDNPGLKEKIGLPINERNYFDLATFWIEDRGHHAGFPHWREWGDERSEKWIRDVKYNAPEFGNHSRPTWGDYAQDSIPVFQQKTIEGHAVRATLLATGIAAAAMENKDARYMHVANNLWDNMVGKRMFITGGVGAIARDEKFGADYFLPSDAYLETCAAVGAGFFSQRMNQLTGQARYMDEFERALYNNVLTGISLEGKDYTYQNPLAAASHHRWGWHDCPCCPPMFLKMVSAVPDFIYAVDSTGINVNLFISGSAEIDSGNGSKIRLVQQTKYPWEGISIVEVSPAREEKFVIRVRIPGWANGQENPFGLYKSKMTSNVRLSVNDVEIPATSVNGYAVIDRVWKAGDKIQLVLPMEPRVVHADGKVADLMSMVAISSGPLVYCLEKNLNKDLDEIKIEGGMPMKVSFESDVLGGVNVITGSASLRSGSYVDFNAIPYFTAGNLKKGDAYKVWIREAK